MSQDNRKAYDLITDQFKQVREQMRLPEMVVRFADLLDANSVILDVGCGSGIPITKYLRDKGFSVIGIDISSRLLEVAKKNIPDGVFIKADIAVFDTHERFKGIIAYDSLFHLKYSEHEGVFRKLYDLLEDNGYLLFTHGGSEGEITGEMFGEEFSYSSLGPEKTKKLLKKLGFKILEWEITQSNDPNDKGHLTVLCKKLRVST